MVRWIAVPLADVRLISHSRQASQASSAEDSRRMKIVTADIFSGMDRELAFAVSGDITKIDDRQF